MVRFRIGVLRALVRCREKRLKAVVKSAGSEIDSRKSSA
jgi:hypothetical protein